MRKFLSGLLCAAMTASLFTVMSGGASADSTAVDSSWQYKTMVDFEDLSVGYQFGGTTDPCSQHVETGEGWQAKVNTGGYKGSNCFYLYSKGDKKGTYAQPLINALGFQNKNTEFLGATEFWMWVDFTHVNFDNVGLEMRLIEDDYNPDGTRAGTDLSQISLGKGKPVYIQSGSSWKSVTVQKAFEKSQYILPTDQMVNYKGFVRIPLSSLVMNKAGTDDNGKIDLQDVCQIWFVFNWPNDNPATDYLAFDQFMFVGPLKDAGKSISNIRLTDSVTTTAATKSGSNTTAAAGVTTAAGSTETTLADSSDVESTDETELTTAAAATTTKTTTVVTAANTEQTKSGSSALPIIIAVICVVVIGGGAALYFFVLKKKFPNGLFKKKNG